jgi:Mrp family chromosome partitioning ATPase
MAATDGHFVPSILEGVSDADLSAVARIKVLLGDRNSIIAITGIDAKDDTGQLSMRLAAALASMDPHRLLLIDGNVRKPELHRRMGCPEWPGFADMLAGEGELDRAIHPTALPNLFVTPVGSAATGLAILLNGSAAQATFAALRGRFRWVVLNAGVITATAEGILLGAASDGVIVGLHVGEHRRNEVEQFAASMKRFGMTMLGAVLVKRKG